MLSAIQTRRHFFNKVLFDTQKEIPDDGTNELALTFSHHKHDDHWHVKLGVQIGMGEHLPKSHYLIDIEAEGLFEVVPDFDKDKIEDLVKMNGGAVLFGAIREMVVTLSSRTNYTPLELPTLDARVFINLPAPEQQKESALLVNKK